MGRSRAWIRVVAAALGVGLGCTVHSPSSSCSELPEAPPSGASISYYRSDTDLNRVHDFVLVADAPCPSDELDLRLGLNPPECVRVDGEWMQVAWSVLREADVHQLKSRDLKGKCIHCGSEFVSVEWSGGRCSVGYGVEREIAKGSQGRFDELTRYLDAIGERIAGPSNGSAETGE